MQSHERFLHIKLIFTALTFTQFTVNSQISLCVLSCHFMFVRRVRKLLILPSHISQSQPPTTNFSRFCDNIEKSYSISYVCLFVFSSIIFHSFISRELSQVSFHLQKPTQQISLRLVCYADCQKRLSTQKQSYIIPTS